MKVLKIDKTAWAEGIEKLRGSYRLFGPTREGSFHNFKEIENSESPDMAFVNTRMSAKSLVYPQSQGLMEYSLDERKEDGHILKEREIDARPRAVLGIRPCDAKAFLLVRKNFDTTDYRDPYWVEAFEKTTFVGFGCDAPCAACFCTTAGCGPFHEEGLDILLAEDGDHFLAEILTEKGTALARSAGWSLEAEGDAGERIEALRAAAEKRITSKVSTDRLASTETMALYEADFWEDVSFSCINCGTCTFLCPTCWCFDIQDETHGKKGVRMRNWDSCMFPLFTLHGSGHNPRGEKLQRVRQRFMHKLKYYVDKYGNGIQCVGCGRCVRFCPVNIDIRAISEKMNSIGADTACQVQPS